VDPVESQLSFHRGETVKRLFVLIIILVAATISGQAQTVQCLTPNGAWGPCPLNASVQLFSATTIGSSALTSPAQKVYNFSMNGVLILDYGSISGSPSGCTLQMQSSDSSSGSGIFISNGSPIPTNPANGMTSLVFTPSANQQSADQIRAVFNCSFFPSGYISLEFVPTGTNTISPASFPEVVTSWTSSSYPTSLAQNVTGYSAVIVFLNQTSALSGGTVTFEASDTASFTNAYSLQCSQLGAFSASSTYNLTANTNTAFFCNTGGVASFRVRLSAGISAGTVNVGIEGSAMTNVPSVAAGITNIAGGSLPVTQSGAWTVGLNGGSSNIGSVDILGNAGGFLDAQTGHSAPGNALQFGAVVATQYPTADSNGQLVGVMADKAGRMVVWSQCPRDLIGAANLPNNTSSSATSFISAGSTGVYNDITSLIITNRSSAATVVTLSDNGSGGNTYTYAIAGYGGIVSNFGPPLTQGTTAAAWEVLNSGGVALDYNAVFCKDK
jgi:hypothetical protein